MLNLPIRMDHMVWKLEGNSFVRVPTFIKGDGNHGGFKVDKVQGIHPSIHLLFQTFGINPMWSIVVLGFKNLQPLPLAGWKARFIIAFGVNVLFINLRQFYEAFRNKLIFFPEVPNIKYGTLQEVVISPIERLLPTLMESRFLVPLPVPVHWPGIRI